MSAASTSLASWAVTVRSGGEIPATDQSVGPLALWLLGAPEGQSQDELRRWLLDVIGVATESASQDETAQPIPALLRHALSGLLFSHSEMWNRPGTTSLCSIALTNSGEDIGFGWIGDATAEVWVDGARADARWVKVRDERGRQANAWSLRAGPDVRVVLSWHPHGSAAAGPGIEIEARCGGFEGAAVGGAPASASLEGSPTPPEDVVASPAAGDTEPQDLHAPMSLEDDALAARIAEEEAPESSAGLREEAAASGPAPEVDSLAAADESRPGHASGAESIATDEGGDAPAATRPSSGIARWLARTFPWFTGAPRGAGRAASAAAKTAEADVKPVGISPDPAVAGSAPAEQQELLPGEIVNADAGARGEARDLDASVADDSGAAPDVPPWIPPARPAMSLEDELAATAAALAAAISELAPAADAPRDDVLEVRDPAPGAASTPDARQVDQPASSPAQVEPPLIAPERVFQHLPEQIPPTPEPPALAARTAPLAAPNDPHEIALPGGGPPTEPVAAPPPAPPRLTLEPRPAAPARPRLLSPAERLAAGELPVDPRGLRDLPPAAVGEAAGADDLLAPASLPAGASAAAPASELAPPSPLPPALGDAMSEVGAAATPEAAPTEAPAGRRRRVLHPDWPVEAEAEARSRKTWIALAAVIVVLFGVGWLLGTIQWNRGGVANRSGGWLSWLGLEGPRYTVQVSSRPDGAWILVDGIQTHQRTPATLRVKPGRHEVTLSFGEWGQAVYPVEGARGAERRIDGTLWGSVDVATPAPGVVLAVDVDGRARGYAPLVVDSLAPGPHQVRFSGPGLPAWGQTVEIHAGQRQELAPQPLESPPTGVLNIAVVAPAAGESEPVKGARVWVDGQPRGVSPLTLELPRGPHSVRVEYQGQEPPIQLIDLPGGNQRFATFEIGSGLDHPPRLVLDAPKRLPAGTAAVVSATLLEVAPADVREMWLHVRGPDGVWNRYAMTRLAGQAAAVGAVAFPLAELDDKGRALYYVSAITAQGDEYFTEILTAISE